MVLKFFLAVLAALFSVGSDAQADRCDIDAITDRIWDQPSCPSGLCRTVLLRRDGTYQISHISSTNPSLLTVFCESGQWRQEPGSCGTLRLKPCPKPCKEAERTMSWTFRGKTLTFGKSEYGISDSSSESTAFVGCTVRRLCNGLSCNEYVGCLKECTNGIFPDSSCPSSCLERVSPDVSHQVTSLLSCARTSGCTDDACIERVCANETRICVTQ
jgi:hypothetical protein